MNAVFDTPLRSAALGVLIIAGIALLRGLLQGRPYRASVLVLTALALGMVLISESIS